MMDFRAFQPVPGRIFDVESEFAVKFAGFWRPGAKIYENRPDNIRNCFFFNLLCVPGIIIIIIATGFLPGIHKNPRKNYQKPRKNQEKLRKT